MATPIQREQLLATEGEPNINGIIFQPGSISWGGAIPIIDHTRNIAVGYAQDFRRDDQNRIFATVNVEGNLHLEVSIQGKIEDNVVSSALVRCLYEEKGNYGTESTF